MSLNPDQLKLIDGLTDLYLAVPDNEPGLCIVSLCLEHPDLHPFLENKLRDAEIVRNSRKRVIEKNNRKSRFPIKETNDRKIDNKRKRRFQKGERLTSGGFAEIFLASCLNDNVKELNQYVMKILKEECCDDREYVERLRTERKISRVVSHTNILPILKFGRSLSAPYLVMPFVNGSTLHNLAKGKPLPYAEAARIVRSVAAACKEVHKQGYIHRDISPSNILIETNTKRVFVIDFGLARVPDFNPVVSLKEKPTGTPGYRAPEQVSSFFGEQSGRADIYSLGANLFFALTGEPPFREPNTDNTGTLEAHFRQRSIFGAVPTRSEIPQSLRLIYSKCLETLPEDRYATVDELLVDLDKYCEGKPMRVHRVSLIKRARNTGLIRPRLTFFFIGILSLLIISSMALLFEQKHRKALELAEALQTYNSDIQSAYSLWRQKNYAAFRERLTHYETQNPSFARGFEWGYLNSLSDTASPVVFAQGTRKWQRSELSVDSKLCALVDNQGLISVFDTNGGENVYDVKVPCCDFCFDQKGSFLAVITQPEGQLQLYKSNDGTLITSLPTQERLSRITFNEAGNLLLAGTQTGHFVGWIIAQGLSTPQRINSLSLTDDIHGEPEKFDLRIPRGQVSAIGVERGNVVVGLETGETELWNLHISDDSEISASLTRNSIAAKHTAPVTGIAFHPRRLWISTQSSPTPLTTNDFQTQMQLGGIHIFDKMFGYHIASIQPHLAPSIAAASEGTTTPSLRKPKPVFHHNSIFSTSDRGVRKWDIDSGKIETEFNEIDRPTIGIARHLETGLIIAIDADGVAYKIDSSSPYKSQVVYNSDFELHQFAIDSTESFLAISHESINPSVHFNREWGKYPRSSYIDFSIRELRSSAIRLTTPIESVSQFNPHFLSRESVLYDGQRHSIREGEVAPLFSFSRRPPFLPSQGYQEIASIRSHMTARIMKTLPFIEVFDTKSPDSRFHLAHNQPVLNATLSSEARRAVTVGRDQVLRLWSLDTGKCICSIETPSSVTSLSFDLEGNLFATGHEDGAIQLWDSQTGKTAGQLQGHHSAVTGLAFFSDSLRLVSCSGVVRTADAGHSTNKVRGQTLLWNIPLGKLCLELESDRENQYVGVQISDDGNRIYAGANSCSNQSAGIIVRWSNNER